MAVTTNAVTVTGSRAAIEANPNQSITKWQINAASGDASGCEEIVAAPGAGKCLCVERLIIGIGAAITVTVGSGETGPGSVEGDKLGPIGGAGGTYVIEFGGGAKAMQLTANKALTFDASGAGAVCVYAEGYTRAS